MNMKCYDLRPRQLDGVVVPIVVVVVICLLCSCASGTRVYAETKKVDEVVSGNEILINKMVRYEFNDGGSGKKMFVFPMLKKNSSEYVYPSWHEIRSRKGFMDMAYNEKVRAHPMLEYGGDRFYIMAPDVVDGLELIFMICHNKKDYAPGDTMLSEIQQQLGSWKVIRYSRNDSANVVRDEVQMPDSEISVLLATAWIMYRRYANAHGQ